jgi:hypothetical protein
MSMTRGKLGFSPGTEIHAEGISTYAMCQAKMYEDLGAHFQTLWADVLVHVSHMQDMICDPTLAKPGEFDSIGIATKPIQYL